MSYLVGWGRVFHHEFAALPSVIQTPVYEALIALQTDPRPPGCIKLADRPEWRVRVGDYRILYEIDDAAQAVAVLGVRHRGTVYR